MKDKASSVIVGVADNNCTRGGYILHEQEYNTGHGVSAIPDEVRREIWRQPRQSKIQQKPVIHLLLEGTLGRHSTISGLPLKTPAQSPEAAYIRRTQADSEYAPPQSKSWYGGAVAPAAQTRIHPPPREPVSGHAQTGIIPSMQQKISLQTQTI